MANLMLILSWGTLFFLHIFSTIFIFKKVGFFLAALVFFAPGIAETAIFFSMWSISGSFINEYSYEFFVSMAWAISFFILAFIFKKPSN